MVQGSNSTTPAAAQQELTSIVVPTAKSKYLFDLSNLSVQSLALLAELSKKRGIEEKLKNNALLLKSWL